MKNLLKSVMVVFLFGFILFWQKPMEIIASDTTPLSISTSYPDTVTCGGATTFTVTASGGSGNYKYRLRIKW